MPSDVTRRARVLIPGDGGALHPRDPLCRVTSPSFIRSTHHRLKADAAYRRRGIPSCNAPFPLPPCSLTPALHHRKERSSLYMHAFRIFSNSRNTSANLTSIALKRTPRSDLSHSSSTQHGSEKQLIFIHLLLDIYCCVHCRLASQPPLHCSGLSSS